MGVEADGGTQRFTCRGVVKNPGSTVTLLEALSSHEVGIDAVLARLARKRPLLVAGIGIEPQVLERDFRRLVDPVDDPGQAERLGFKRLNGKLDFSDEMRILTKMTVDSGRK